MNEAKQVRTVKLRNKRQKKKKVLYTSDKNGHERNDTYSSRTSSAGLKTQIIPLHIGTHRKHLLRVELLDNVRIYI